MRYLRWLAPVLLPLWLVACAPPVLTREDIQKWDTAQAQVKGQMDSLSIQVKALAEEQKGASSGVAKLASQFKEVSEKPAVAPATTQDLRAVGEDQKKVANAVEKLSSQFAALESKVTPSKAAPSPTSAAEQFKPVVKLYQDACSGCHGPQRQGATGPALIPQRIGGVGDEFIKTILLNGRPGTAMPPWKGVITDSQISDLISYIKSPVEASTLTWDMQDIKATRQIIVPESNLPDKPTWGGQATDLMVIVERDIGNLLFVDSRTHQPLKHIQAGYAIHSPTFTSKEAGDRWLWAIARNGWLVKVDLYSLQVVGKIRVGLDSRGTAVSRDGKYVIAGNYIPNSAVIVDVKTLEPLKVIKAFGVDPKGQSVESRVAGIVSTPVKPYFELVLKEAGQVWVVDYSKPDFPVVATFNGVGNILHEAFLTADGRYMQVASQDDGTIVVIDLMDLKVVKKIPAGKKPHPGPGAVWEMKGKKVAGTPAIGEGLVTVWDTATWEVLGMVKTSGPGLFIRSHPQSQYVWVDVAFGEWWDDIYVFDKDTLQVVKVLKDGKRTIHPEFTNDARYVYVSAWNSDEILVYDAKSFQVIKRIQAKTPTGIFSVGIRQEEPGN